MNLIKVIINSKRNLNLVKKCQFLQVDDLDERATFYLTPGAKW